MKDKPNQKNQGNQIPASAPKNKNNRWFIISGILIIAVAAYMFWRSAEITPIENTVSSAPVAQSSSPDTIQEKLAGRWQRTDGGYIIELKNPTPEGLIDASYFNPNPINVGKSAWQNKAGKLMVLVELQDQNYPGSIYTLEYQPQGDRLTGIYFQAVEKVSYQVEFTRAR